MVWILELLWRKLQFFDMCGTHWINYWMIPRSPFDYSAMRGFTAMIFGKIYCGYWGGRELPFLLFPLPLIQTCSWLNNKIVWLVTSPSDIRFSEELRCPARSVENTDGPIKASILPAEPLASDKSAPRWFRQRLYFKQALHSRPAQKFFPVPSHPVLSSNHLITMHLMEELKGNTNASDAVLPDGSDRSSVWAAGWQTGKWLCS